MTNQKPTSKDLETAALMLALNGLSPRDIATHLRCSEVQVRRWLSHDHERSRSDDD